MESSRAASRCLQQLHRLPPSTSHKAILPRSRRISAPCPLRTRSQLSSRSFSTSLHKNQDEQPEPPKSSTTQDATSPRPQRSSAFTTRPSTSSIYKPQSDTVPPKPRTKSDLGASTLAAIDALISQNRARAAAAANPSSNTSSPRTYNEDIYGRGGSVAQRSSETASSSFAYPNMRTLLNDLGGTRGSSGPLGFDEKEPEIFLRLKPTLGKTADLDESRSIGLTRAFQMLESRINKGGNRVKRDMQAQRFHVRRGQARKINKRLRWRELFKQGFLGEITRVRRMIKQGW